jgi:hypothetical protein
MTRNEIVELSLEPEPRQRRVAQFARPKPFTVLVLTRGEWSGGFVAKFFHELGFAASPEHRVMEDHANVLGIAGNLREDVVRRAFARALGLRSSPTVFELRFEMRQARSIGDALNRTQAF